MLKLDFEILNRIGHLTSDNRGDYITARKYSANQQPLTTREAHWLEAAVRATISQLAILDAGGRPAPIALADLPKY